MNVDETKPLLIELFTEELPPKALKKLGVAFQQYLWDSLAESDLVFAAQKEPNWFATPRRLAARFDKVRSKAPSFAIRDKLMPLSVARTVDGHASPALLKKLSSTKLDQLLKGKIDFPATYTGEGGRKISLVVESDGKTEYVFLVGEKEGDSIEQGVQRAIDYALAKLPIPKVMNYQLADGVTEANFVRPAHGLVAMYGSDVITATALGLTSSNISHGHRFQGANNIEIGTASRYEEFMRQYGKVEPVYEKRHDMILKQLKAKAESLGATLGALETYADLLDEVNALVEWPTVYVCQFEPEFLAVPQECLILTMKTNQKYFPLFDENGKLKNQFLIVSNMELDDPSRVITGNERVVRPRLADARFFFETDKKTKLEARVPELAKVVYHNKLGTTGERIERLSKLAGEIAALIGADVAKSTRAATLAKADLVTLMVGEFPELQGTMGRYYALNDGEEADVAAACAEHYQPRFAGDALPSPGVPTAVALADKLETLTGLFGIGQVPTGDKDPFALRRHALGVLRILIEQALPIDLPQLLKFAAETFGARISNPDEAKEKAYVFITDRLAAYLRDGGFSAQVVEAVDEAMGDRPAWGELPGRLAAVKAFSALPEAMSLNAANKRVANILKKAEEAKEAIAANSAPQEPAEAELRTALNAIAPKADALFAKGDFTGYLKSFAALKTPVDEFFDKVMVMADDKAVRANRLALLRDLRDAMNKVADLSKLAA
jgi:glycyl-tRNA synthetase beta chain